MAQQQRRGRVQIGTDSAGNALVRGDRVTVLGPQNTGVWDGVVVDDVSPYCGLECEQVSGAHVRDPRTGTVRYVGAAALQAILPPRDDDALDELVQRTETWRARQNVLEQELRYFARRIAAISEKHISHLVATIVEDESTDLRNRVQRGVALLLLTDGARQVNLHYATDESPNAEGGADDD